MLEAGWSPTIQTLACFATARFRADALKALGHRGQTLVTSSRASHDELLLPIGSEGGKESSHRTP